MCFRLHLSLSLLVVLILEKLDFYHWVKLSETLLYPVHYFQIFMGGINILWGGQYILKGGPPGGGPPDFFHGMARARAQPLITRGA